MSFDRWEYRIHEFGKNTREAEAELNRSGEEGWELVSVKEHPGGYLAFLKRENRQLKKLPPTKAKDPSG